MADTIIGVPYETDRPLRSLLHDAPHEQDPCEAEDASNRQFKIRMADSTGRRSSASILVNRMYSRRGYACDASTMVNQPPSRVTVVASEHEHAIGTITVGFDSPSGLLVDDLFFAEANELRDSGRRLCEFTKLAIDSVVKSKRVLASLFHVAYIHAHRLMDCDNLLIEVNPRHVRYYQRMLGFRTFGPERLNRRVNAPAVLLNLELSHARAQIARWGGRPGYGLIERSLYPYFFSTTEEHGIVGRLRRMPEGREEHEGANQEHEAHGASVLAAQGFARSYAEA